MRVPSRVCRIAVAAGAALCLTTVGMVNASADTAPTYFLGSFGGNYTVSPGTAGGTFGYYVQAQASTPTTFSGITVSYDVSGLAGVATLTPQSGKCTTSGTIITCKAASLTADQFNSEDDEGVDEGRASLPLLIAPAAGAATGASGTVQVTISASNPVTTPNTATLSVSLADGVDLSVKGSDSVNQTADANADSTYSHGLTFTNIGDQPANGVTVEVRSYGYGVDLAELHSNCEYQSNLQAYCYVPDVVAPGATETLSPGIKFLTYTDLMWQGALISVVPGYASFSSSYTTGTGAPYTLTDSTGATQVPASGQTAQNNLNGGDNTLTPEIVVAGSSADVAATATMFPWQVPDQYLMSGGVTNNGPDYVNLGTSPAGPMFQFDGTITFPAGVTVVSAPGLVPIVDGSEDFAAAGQPGYSEYEYGAGSTLAEGQVAGLGNAGNVIIQPDSGFTGGDGTITTEINNVPTANFNIFGDFDTDPSNDTTSFAIPAYDS